MIYLQISRAAFQEIALLLCSAEDTKRLCKTLAYDKWRNPVDGRIKRIDLPGLRLEPV